MRKTSTNRFVTTLPDPKFGDVVVTKFVNNLMWEGKKNKAFGIFYEALDIVAEKTGDGAPVAPALVIGATDSRYAAVLTPNVYRFSPAVLTPADPASMILLAAPLYALYELGLLLMWLVPTRQAVTDGAMGDE